MFHRDTQRAAQGRAPTRLSRRHVGTFSILARSRKTSPGSQAVDAMFENSPYPTKTESEREFGTVVHGVHGKHQAVPAGDLLGG
jgi:hypothetical protein